MIGNIEGILVQLSSNGSLGIMTSDHMVHELGETDGFEVLEGDGIWREVDALIYHYQDYCDDLGENENSMSMHLGMPARYKVLQSDKGLINIPDGIDDELPEIFRRYE